ncbi:predicted protein [Nematostella vectensis]|uniref:Ubiquitin-like domain-containing protein n=1 Tax=Nematostella vectensis TaxID=45351 RepID=A7SNX4_NEMVE|nr:predicted protein [Nematostella vectensis]|eukprot:XP_001626675.1 predicted protein [Nematostella vectensis]
MADEDAEDSTEFEGLSHSEAMSIFRKELSKVMQDPLLVGLPSEPTVEEITAQLALEHGLAIMVNVRQQDKMATILPVVVVQDATVLDLKKAIQRHITLKQTREGGATYISWKYVWRTFWLMFEGQKLSDDHKSLKEYGISSRDEVTFAKRLKRK